MSLDLQRIPAKYLGRVLTHDWEKKGARKWICNRCLTKMSMDSCSEIRLFRFVPGTGYMPVGINTGSICLCALCQKIVPAKRVKTCSEMLMKQVLG